MTLSSPNYLPGISLPNCLNIYIWKLNVQQSNMQMHLYVDVYAHMLIYVQVCGGQQIISHVPLGPSYSFSPNTLILVYTYFIMRVREAGLGVHVS